MFGFYGNRREQEENLVALDVTVEMVTLELPDPLDPPGPPDKEWVWLNILTVYSDPLISYRVTEGREGSRDPKDNQVISVYRDLPVQLVPTDKLLVFYRLLLCQLSVRYDLYCVGFTRTSRTLWTSWDSRQSCEWACVI